MKLNPRAEHLKINPKAPISNWIIEEYSKLEQELIDLKNTHSTLLVALDYNRKERDELKNSLTSFQK
jgi:2'-5' RNA ligase